MSDHMVYIGYDYGEIKIEAFKIYTQPEYNQQEYEFLIDDCIDSERCKRPPIKVVVAVAGSAP